MVKLPILMYHYVRPRKKRLSERHNVLDSELFTNQIELLAKNFDFLVGDNLFDEANKQSKFEKQIWLTFDDGYRDCTDYVLPVLLKNKACATFYVPTEAVFARKLLDVNKIHILLSCGASSEEIVRVSKRYFCEMSLENQVGKSFDELFSVYGVENTYNDKNTEFIKKIFQKALPTKIRKIFLDEVFRAFVTRSESSWVDELYLNSDDIRALWNSGMEIGSHGHSHEWLEDLTEFEQASDIKTSLELLHTEIPGLITRSICYPYGSYNKSTLKVLDDLKIRTGLLNNFESNYAFLDLISESYLELERIDVMFFDQFFKQNFAGNSWNDSPE